MGLVNMTTNLKDLRYGKDTIGGGSSGQPYVSRSIPDSFSDLGKTGGPDFLLRGGSLLPRIIAKDVSRLTKMFFDFKSPSGPLFIAKQNVLSLTNVNSEKGYEKWVEDRGNNTEQSPQSLVGRIGDFIKSNIGLNQGLYLPLSTIAQPAVGTLGVHLNKQGWNPIKVTTKGSPDGNTILGLPTYLNTIATGGNEGNKSRLEPLLLKINKKQTDNILFEYGGGPGSILGVGKTKIRVPLDQRTGVNNPYLESELKYTQNFGKNKIQNLPLPNPFGRGSAPQSIPLLYNPSVYTPGLGKNKNIDDIQRAYGATIKFAALSQSPKYSAIYLDTLFNSEDAISPNSFSPSVYNSGNLTTNVSKLSSGIGGRTPIQVFTQGQIENYTPTSEDGKIKESFTKLIAPSGSQQIPDTLDYTKKNFEQRVNLGDPGRRGNLKSYTIGKQEINSTTPLTVKDNSYYTKALDKINAFPLYQSNSVTTDNDKNDFVKFRIGVIDNDNPTKKTYIHFRAIIDEMSDNFTAEWKGQKFMGRGEQFYKYGGFDRKISLGWTVVAQSKQELIPMYQKLNYLSSVCAPDYSNSGYMRGNLITLTVGGYLQEQVGIMTGINYSVPTESPWEIGIPDNGNIKYINQGDNEKEIFTDPSVKEMPMMINVSGFTFIPIHDFVPQLQQNDYNGKQLSGGGKFISKYGPEQYINLAAASGNNYDGNGQNINYIPKKSK